MLAKFVRFARRLFAALPGDRRAVAVRDALDSMGGDAASPIGRGVVVQCVEDPLYVGVFGAVCRRLLGARPAELIVIRSISSAVGAGWLEWLERSTLMTVIRSSQWVRIFSSFANAVAYRSVSFSHPVGDLLDWWASGRLWRHIRGETDISGLQIRGIQVGDLVIDSYLRFKPSPRFDAADPFVRRLLWQAYRDARRSLHYFRFRKPSIYLTSYSTYIEHGIPVRAALSAGVDVRSFGNFVQFGKRLTRADWYHTPAAGHYRSVFESLDRQAERLERAEQQLRLRLSGGVDAATSYMRKSAYAAQAGPIPEVAGAVVVFLHDFYDSPHIYSDLIFPDFWAWTCFTIETLRRSGQPFFLKPHPNQISLSGAVLDELRAKYPDLPMLTVGVTNVQLAEAGMLCGVTVYGTVAHELAYLGIPTIACARHPHHSFDFCRTATNIEQYREFLQSPGVYPLSREQMRHQALAFYYMHNLHGDAESLELRSKFVSLWKASNNPDPADSGSHAELLRRFREFTECSGFAAAVAAMAREGQ